jgi:hypothetical protein
MNKACNCERVSRSCKSSRVLGRNEDSLHDNHRLDLEVGSRTCRKKCRALGILQIKLSHKWLLSRLLVRVPSPHERTAWSLSARCKDDYE